MRILLLVFISITNTVSLCASEIFGDTLKGYVFSLTYTSIDPDFDEVRTAEVTFKTPKGKTLGKAITNSTGSFCFIIPDSSYTKNGIRVCVKAKRQNYIRGPVPTHWYYYRYKTQNMLHADLNSPFMICIKRTVHRGTKKR